MHTRILTHVGTLQFNHTYIIFAQTHTYTHTHTAIPDPIDLDEGDLGELKDMIAAEITFSAEFSNVLLITIKLHLLKDGCTDAQAEFDQDFLVSCSFKNKLMLPYFDEH